MSAIGPAPIPLSGGWIGVTIEAQAAPIAVTGSLSFSGAVDQGLGGSSAWKVDGSAVTQPVSAAALPLPAGAATEATLGTLATEATLAGALTTAAFQARVATLGQKAMAGSMPVALASDQSAIPVAGPLTDAQLRASAVPVSGPLTDAQLRANAVVVGDGGGSLTVDGSVSVTGALPAGGNTIGLVSQGVGGASAWKVDGSAITQPVSAAALPLPAGAATEATLGGVLTTSAFQARVATLGQKAMAGSMPVVFASDQTSIPVTGPLTDAQLRASAVPVSGPLTDAQLRASAVAVGDGGGSLTVDGSVSVTGALPAGANTIGLVSQGLGGASAWKVDGSAVTQPVSAAALPLPAGAATEATLASVLTTTAFQARVATLGQKAMAGSMPVVFASDQSAIPVTGPLTDAQLRASAVLVSGPLTDAQLRASAVPVSGPLTDAQLRASAVAVSAPTLTKGTQGAQGFSTQDLKDSGRARVVVSFEAAAPAVADTLLTLVKKTNGVSAAGATTIAVTAGKTLRITTITFSLRDAAAATAFATLTLRENPSGAVLISSPSWGRFDLSTALAAIGAADKIVVPFTDGIEFSGAQQIGASLAAQAVTNVVSIELYGFEY